MNDNSRICSVICGAPCGLDKGFVTGFLIAADSGIDRCKEAGIVPDMAVGDFDSALSEIPNDVEVVRVPSEKDDTDTYLAAHIAEERGFEEIRFFCALGGRLSHTLANIQLLRELKRKGIRAALFGENCVMFLLKEQSVRIPRFNGYLSLFALDSSAAVSESGVKYSLERHTLTNEFPLGVSNEITAEQAEITVHSGLCAIVLETNVHCQF